MTDSTGSTKASEADVSEGSSGFRSFLRRQSHAQEGSEQSGEGGSKLSNIFSRSSRSSSVTEEGSSEGGGTNAAQKRRQQVYQAQKRHRNRKAEYVQNLEAEVSRLLQMDAQVNNEKNTLAQQNQAMKAILAAQSIDAQLDAIGLSAPTTTWTERSLENADIDIRFDEQMGHDRTFLDFTQEDISMSGTSSSGAPHSSASPTPQHTPIKGDSWAALDFILALEWPCQTHIVHAQINPDAKLPVACAVGGFHGHALTATNAVYSSAQPPVATSSEHTQLLQQAVAPRPGLPLESKANWQLSHSEIDKLVALSEKLELDDDQMTPAQAYAAVKESVPSDEYLRPVLQALKEPLGKVVNCAGLGAVLPAEVFWQSYEAVVQNLDFTSSEPGPSAS